MMPDDDSEHEAAVAEALRTLSSSLSVDRRRPAKTVRPPKRRNIFVGTAAAAVVAAIAVVAVVAFSGRSTSERHTLSPAPSDSTVAGPVSTAARGPVSTAVTETSPDVSSPTEPSATTASSPDVQQPTLPVGLIDSPSCQTAWIRTANANDDYVPYGLSPQPMTVQVFATSPEVVGSPFIVVIRSLPPASGGTNPAAPAHGGPDADAIHVSSLRGGFASWDLGDGSHVYVRDGGFTSDELGRILATLVPRPLSSQVPGFDVLAPNDAGLRLVDETSEPLRLEPAGRSTCRTASGGEVLVRTYRGSRTAIFTAYLDQSAPLPPTGFLDDKTLVDVTSRATDADLNQLVEQVRFATVAESQAVGASLTSGEIQMVWADLPRTALDDRLVTSNFDNLDDLRAAVQRYLPGRLPQGEILESVPDLYLVLSSGGVAGDVGLVVLKIERSTPGYRVVEGRTAVRCPSGALEPDLTRC